MTIQWNFDEKVCEVCGYDKTSALFICPDTIIRCKHCRDKSIFGCVITDEMLRDAKLAKLNQINERYEQWEKEAKTDV